MGCPIACLFLIWFSIFSVLTLIPISMIVQGCNFCTRGPFQTMEMQSTGVTDFDVYHGAGSPYFVDHDDVTRISLYGMMQFREANDNNSVECWAAAPWVVRGYKWDDAEEMAKIEFPKGTKRVFYVVPQKSLCLDVRYSETAEYDVEVAQLNGICILCTTQSSLWMILFFLLKRNGCFQARNWRFRRVRKSCSRFRRWLARPYYRYTYYRWLQRLPPPATRKSICLEPVLTGISDIYVLNTDGKNLQSSHEALHELRQGRERLFLNIDEFRVENRSPEEEEEHLNGLFVV